MKKVTRIFIVLILFLISCGNQKKDKEEICTEIINQILPSIIDSLKIKTWNFEKLNIVSNPIYILDTIYHGISIDEIRSAAKFHNYNFPNDSFNSMGDAKVLITSAYVYDTLQIISVKAIEDANKNTSIDSKNRITLVFSSLMLNGTKNYGVVSATELIGKYVGGNTYTFFIKKNEGKWVIERCLLTGIR